MNRQTRIFVFYFFVGLLTMTAFVVKGEYFTSILTTLGTLLQGVIMYYSFTKVLRTLELDSTIEFTEKDETLLAEQNRKIGELIIKCERLEDSERRREDWLYKAKQQAGANQNVSFDDVWNEVLKYAKEHDFEPSDKINPIPY